MHHQIKRRWPAEDAERAKDDAAERFLPVFCARGEHTNIDLQVSGIKD